MVDAVGGSLSPMQIAGGWQSKVTIVQPTAEQKAAMAESDKAVAYAQKVEKEYKDAWARKAAGDTGMQLGDVSKQSPQTAAGSLAAMNKLREVYGENGLQISATRGQEKTTSISTYISWLQERAGAASVNDATQASLFNLKV